MINYLKKSINITAFYIDFNIFTKSWPEIFFVNNFSRLFDYKIVCQWIIMIMVDYLRINNLKDVRKSLIIEYILQILSALQ